MIQTGRQEQQNEQLEKLLKEVNSSRSSDYGNLEYKIQDAKRNIKYTEDNLKRYQKDLADYENQQAKLKDDRLQLPDLLKSFDQIKRHKHVDWAFITPNCELIIQTKPLMAFDPLLEVDTDECVGRYVFKVGLKSTYKSFTIAALDFVVQGYRHPNLMSHPADACWGGYNHTIRKMFDSGDFFAAVDAMILFFSTFPQQGGHRPLYWYVWLNQRKVSFYKNPWFDLAKDAIYTIGKPTEAKPKRFKVTRRNEIMIDGTMHKLKGLNFRNY